MVERSTVAIVDDDINRRGRVVQTLQGAGFEVLATSGGAEMRGLLGKRPIDLIVLEAALPGEDGLTLARYLRQQHPQIAVLLVSAAADAIDRIVGLEIGADDYLAKPFDLRELTARVKSILRRLPPPTATTPRAAAGRRLPFGHCVLDLDSKCLYDREGREIPLGRLEFALLKTFAEHPRRVLSRDRLLDLAHDGHHEPYDRSVDVRIGRIRRKIEQDPSRPRIIRTVRGAGYMYTPGGD